MKCILTHSSTGAIRFLLCSENDPERVVFRAFLEQAKRDGGVHVEVAQRYGSDDPNLLGPGAIEIKT